MIHLLKEQHDTLLKKKDLIDLEEQVLRSLDFGVHHVSAIPFLERYLRVYGID